MKFTFTFPVRCILAAFSGALFAAAFAQVGWRWLVVPGLVGLFVALDGQKGTRARALGFLHGMVAYGIGISWLYQIFGSMVVVLWAVLAAFTALFAEMQSRAVTSGVVGWKLLVFTALNWCAWEFIRAELFPLKFPWMTVGLALGPNRFLPWIGVYAVGVPVVMAAACIAMRKWRSASSLIWVLAAVIGLNSRILAPAENDPLAVRVGGLQLEGVSLNEYLAGTKKMPDDVDLVVWPEYSVPFDVRKAKRD
jgi:apolipoprotein N-acyltransferase